MAKASVKPAVDAAKAGKWVFTFGDGKAEGKAELRDLLGGKGANLAEMANLGLPVPPGFTIPTSVCTYFYAHDKSYPAALKAQVEKALDHVGKLAGKAFGDSKNSAAGVGAFRWTRLDAGHDGYRAQSRPQRRDGRGAG
ncbi:MAG: PEP/pyruvate-binding domain-containing protein [Bradyrhizobium sp.]